MPTIAKLVVRLSLDDKQFQKGINSAIRTAQSAEKKIAQSTKKSTKGGIASTLKSTFANLGQKLSPAINKASSFISKGFSKGLSTHIGPGIKRFTSLISSGIARAAPAAKAAFGIISKGALALGAGMATAGAAVLGFGAAIGIGAGKLAMAAAPIQGIQGAFQGITSTIEGGSQRMLASLQKASSGMVTNAELMRQFNTAAQLVSVDFAQKLPDAMEAVGKVSAATGQDIGFLMNSLTVGVGRLSAPILDNLAIQVDLNAAYQTFADKNGLVASSLTKSQQQMALMDQVTSKLLENTKNMPPVFGSASQVFGAFRTDLANIKDQMGMDLLPTFTQLFMDFRKFMPMISSFGKLFSGAFAGLVNVAKSFGRGIARSLGVDMENLSGDMEGYGENIVTQLARGMAKAIGAVISVLNQLGQMIASWLAPGSPPKLLPDLPDWGENAGNWFLKGFTNANVSIMRDLSGQMESFIRSNMAGKSSEAIAKKVLKSRGKLENALATGGNIVSAVPKQMRGYAAALIESQQAATRLEKAQDALNKVTKEYDDKLAPIGSRLAEIQAERDKYEQGQRKAELQAIVDDPTADKDAVRFAQLELEEIALQNQQAALEANKETAVNAAQEKVNAAQSEMDMAEQRLQLEQELLQHQIETNNLMASTISKMGEMGAAAGAIGGAAGALESVQNAMSGIGGVAPALGSTMSELAESIMGEFDGIGQQAEALGETWGDVATGIIGKAQEIIDWWTTNFGEGGVWPGIMDMASQIFQTQWGEGGTWQGNMDNLKKIGQGLVDWWQSNWGEGGTWSGIMDMATNIIQSQWGEGGTWSGIIDNLQTIITTLKDKWQENLDKIREATAPFTTKITEFLGEIEGKLADLTKAIKDVLHFFERLKKFIEDKMPDLPNLPSVGGGPNFAQGTHGQFLTVPQGFNDDTFPVFLSSGEEFMVKSRSETSFGSSGGNQPVFNNYGDINNGMDLAQLEAKVRRWIRTEMKR